MPIKQKYITDPFETKSIKTKVSGTVTSANTADKIILAYDRLDGKLLGSTLADRVTGDWAIFLPCRGDETLTILCRDEGSDFNADIYDRISLCTEDFVSITEYTTLIFPIGTLLETHQGSYSQNEIISFPYLSITQNIRDTIRQLNSINPLYEGVFENDVGAEITVGPTGSVPEIVPGVLVNDNLGVTGLGSVLLDGVIEYGLTPDIFSDGSDELTIDFQNGNIVDKSGNYTPSNHGWKPIIRQHGYVLDKITWGNKFHTGMSLSNANDWTIAFWINVYKVYNASYYPEILSQLYDLKIAARPSASTIQIRTGNGTAWNTNHSVNLGWGDLRSQWLHIAVTTNSSTLTIYVNGGVPKGSWADTGISGATDNSLYFDAGSSQQEALSKINNVRVFNRVLSEAEVGQLYTEVPSEVISVDTIKGSVMDGNSFTLTGSQNIPKVGLQLRGNWVDSFVESFTGSINGIFTLRESIMFIGESAIHSLPTCADVSADSVGDESNIDIVCKFQPSTLIYGTNQVLYKSGDATNGLAVAIDSVGNLGIYGRLGGTTTSILITPDNLIEHEWFTLLGTSSELKVFNEDLQEITSTLGTATAGNGDGQQSIGGVCNGSPVSGVASGEHFLGKISDIKVFQGNTGELSFPSELRLACELGETGTQCYVEVEKWDIENNLIELWVKIPTLPSNVDTKLRFYFSTEHDANTDYVGHTGDTAAQNVWDTDYIAVYHMVNDSGIVKDSTINALHHSFTGGTTVAGLIGDAINCNGTSDYGSISDAAFEITAGGLTYEATLKRSATTPTVSSLLTKGQAGANLGANLGIPAGSNELTFGTVTDHISGGNITTNVLENIAGTYDGTGSDSGLALYASGTALTTTVVGTFTGFGASGEPFTIGAESDDGIIGAFFDNILDEVRISDIERSANWLALTDKSNKDELISFSQGSLEGWAQSPTIQIKIDHTKIDANLVNYPILIEAHSRSGGTNFDFAPFFEEIGMGDIQKFTGNVLDTSIWGTFIDPNGSVIQNDQLELSLTSGGVHNGVWCYSHTTFDYGSDLEVEFDVTPGNISYSGVPGTVFNLKKPGCTRWTYGQPYDCIYVSLRDGSGNGCICTRINNGAGATSVTNFTALSVGISYHIKITLSSSNYLRLYVDTVLTAEVQIDSTDITSLGSYELEFGVGGYQTVATSIFDNFYSNRAISSDGIKRFALEHVNSGEQCYCEIVNWNKAIVYPWAKVSPTWFTYSNGDKTITRSSSGWHHERLNTTLSTGKYFWETTIEVSSANQHTIGIVNVTDLVTLTYPGSTATSYGYNGYSGYKYSGGSPVSYGSSFTVGDIIGIALDLINRKIFFSKNGIWQDASDPVTGVNPAYIIGTGDYIPAHGMYTLNDSCAIYEGTEYSVPEDYQKLHSEDVLQLYAKIPTINSLQDEILNLYYNSTKDPNIGDVYPIYYFKFNENIGLTTITDEIVGDTASIVNGGAVASGGKFNNHVDLPNNNHGIQFTPTDSFNFLGDFTFEYWYKEASNTDRSVFALGNADKIRIRVHNTSVYLYTDGANTTASYTPVPNVYEHHAIIREGTTVTYYINGISMITRTMSGTVAETTLYFNQGVLNGGYAIDDLLIYDFAKHTQNFAPPNKEAWFGFVEDTGSLIAQNVWDDDFLFVCHFSQDPNLGNVLDSTGNQNNLVFGAGTLNLYTLLGDKRLHFIHGDLGASIGVGVTALTYDIFAKRIETLTSDSQIIDCNNDYDFCYRLQDNGNINFGDSVLGMGTWIGVWSDFYSFHSMSISFADINSNGTHIASTDLVFDGTSCGTTICNTGSTNIGFFNIGRDAVEANPFEGELSEFRISKSKRLYAWQKATHYSNKDDLLTFSEGRVHNNPLSGWENYIALEGVISQTDVPSVQTNFPVRVNISNQSGLGGISLSSILDYYHKAGEWSGTLIQEAKLGTDRNNLDGFLTDNLAFSSNSLNMSDSALYFDGSGDQVITLPEKLRSVIGGDICTIAFYIKLEIIGVNRSIFGTTYRHELLITQETNNTLLFRYGNGSQTHSISNTDSILLSGEWIHVVYVRDLPNGVHRFYLNADLQKEADISYSVYNGTNPLLIGDSSYTPAPYTGYLSDVFIYPTVLNDTEIKTLYADRELNTYLDNFCVQLYNLDFDIFPLFLGTDINSVIISGIEDNQFVTIAFTINHDTYYIYISSVWRAIASKDDAIHGNAGDTDWYFRDSADVWAKDQNTANIALAKAFEYFENRMNIPQTNSLTPSVFSGLFNNTVGIFDVAVGLKSIENFKVPRVTRILYNNFEYWLSELYDLAPYDTIIVGSEVKWEYRDSDAHFKVYTIKTGDASWTECTVNGGAIPGITPGMATVGVKMQFKVEFDVGLVALPEEINLGIIIT